MKKALLALDRILRGEATRDENASLERGIDVPVGSIIVVEIVLGMIYGLCMGTFAVVTHRAGEWKQMLSAAVKVPALFFFTLIVTLPSLYVFNALVGSRLTLRGLSRLLAAAMGVTLALLASFGTIVAFFSFTTKSHPFMVLLNVVAFTIAGIMGLSFLLRTLRRLSEPPIVIPDPKYTPAADAGAPMSPNMYPPPVTRLRDPYEAERRANFVFRIWITLFALVGAQMSWILRPFIGGRPEFALFREQDSNFFAAVYELAKKLFGHE